MYSVVQGMRRLLEELGGTVLTGREVERIQVRRDDRGRSRAEGVWAGGVYFPADVVVSNADVAHTYRDLVEPRHRARWTDRRIAKQAYTMSCFLLYLGVRRQYPQLAHHTLILTERFRGLLDDIFRRKVLPDDFSMYLHAPTRTDPGMAPEGCESLYVLVPVANNASGIDWSDVKDEFARRILDYLEQWGLEDLTSHLDVLHVFTPDDFESELNAHLGNAFALEPRFTQTAWFRPHNRSEDVDGLYLVGAGTHPGAGVPGVVLSAEATYGCIAEDLGLPAQWNRDEPGRVALAPELGGALAAEVGVAAGD
jgi:phytoene desaturase